MDHRYLRKNMSLWIPVGRKRRPIRRTEARPKSTFQESIRGTLVIGQFFSLMPIAGVFSNNVNDVRFVLTSWKCVYSFFSLLGQFLITITAIISLFNSNVNLEIILQVITHGTACTIIVIFFQIAKAWPNLVQHIAHVEELDPSTDKTLTMKCNVMCAIVLLLSPVEYILLLFLEVANISTCFPKYSFCEGFTRLAHPGLINFIGYSPVLGFITQFLQFQSMFAWHFSNLFVICMSYYLTSRLNLVNKKLLAAQGKYLPEIFWRDLREEYGRATQLVRKFDEVIGGIVFITFGNLVTICYQLYKTLAYGINRIVECENSEKRTTLLGNYEAVAFQSFSLVYVIVRSIAVSLIVSEVNSASMVPAPILYDVPSSAYGVEVQRFLDQVDGEEVALSGLQFFSITRGLLLNVAATIVTYELVMFQFKIPYSLVNSTLASINFTTDSM